MRPRNQSHRERTSGGSEATTGTDVPQAARSWSMVIAGFLLLLAAAGASLVLVLQHMLGLSVIGCGPGSACARAANSVWGKVPGIGWPTSHVGFAWFLAIAAAWIMVRGAFPGWLRWAVRLSAFGSLVLMGAMVIGDYVCPWCMGVHFCNLAFVILMETGGRSMSLRRGGLVPALTGLVFALTTTALAVAESREKATVAAQQEEDLAQSTAEIIRGSREQAERAQEGPSRLSIPLTGRYRIGPERAPIRIVAFTGYQCPDCQRVEKEIEGILAERDDISFSIKQFPLCSDCNRFARDTNFCPHPNACWAARAAEAAGLLYGEEGFWKMHRWLFDRGGSFTASELNVGLDELGFDRDPFLRWMQSPRTLELVEADIEQGRSLGLHFTPMIFVNGVELRGWRSVNAVRRAVTELAATDPPPLTAENDRPVLALGKYVEDWRQEFRRQVAPPTRSWLLPELPENPIRVTVFGDYSEPNSVEVDRLLRALAEAHPRVVYTFRMYPMNNACNSAMQGEMAREGACEAARAAEAAGRLGGREGYLAMHAWLMENSGRLTESAIRSAATRMGMSGSALLGEMGGGAVKAGIDEDTDAARRAFVRGVPHIMIDDRHVPRWRFDNRPIFEDILRELLEEK